MLCMTHCLFVHHHMNIWSSPKVPPKSPRSATSMLNITVMSLSSVAYIYIYILYVIVFQIRSVMQSVSEHLIVPLAMTCFPTYATVFHIFILRFSLTLFTWANKILLSHLLVQNTEFVTYIPFSYSIHIHSFFYLIISCVIIRYCSWILHFISLNDFHNLKFLHFTIFSQQFTQVQKFIYLL